MSEQRTTADARPCPCGRHELCTVTEIGDWIQGIPGSPTVREWAADPDIWTEGRCKLPREELRRRIQEAGGINCEHALEATPGAPTHLSDGVHRWAVAADLRINEIPVRMLRESPFAWMPDSWEWRP